MQPLLGTTDSLEIVTSAACDVDYIVSWVDASNATPPVLSRPDRSHGNITTATTTANVVATPASGVCRNIKEASIRNDHASSPVDITVQYDISGTKRSIIKITLLAGETLSYTAGTGWFRIPTSSASNPMLYNVSVADQASGFATDTYITGSNLLIGGRMKVGTIMRWNIHATKTAFGTATPIWNVRFGTAGAIGDTARNVMTGPAQTAVADNGLFTVEAYFSVIGTSAIVRAKVAVAHSAAAAAGFGECVANATSAAFDATTPGLQVGLSVNGGSAAVWTLQGVTAIAANLS
jgi:hypothetical protein